MSTGFAIGDRGLGASGDIHPQWMMAHAEIGPYLVVGASSIGQIHLARQLHRDDAFVIRAVGPWLAVAVADGVGSRPLSRYGATYVVESLTALILRKLAPSTREANKTAATNALATHNQASAPPHKEDAEIKNLAPPLSLEQLELRPWFEFSSPAPDSNRSMVDPPAHVSNRELPPQEFLQVGSIGWWLSPTLKGALTHPTQTSTAAPQQFKPPGPVVAHNQHASGADLPSAIDSAGLIEIMNQAYTNTHLGLHQHAISLGVDVTDLSCTALAFLLNVETGQTIIGQIGDGAVLGLSAEGKVEELVHGEDTGDPQSTYTISRPNYSKHLAIASIDHPKDHPFKAFYVMTDGLSGDLLYSKSSADEWAKALNANVQAASATSVAAAQMLNWLSTYQVKGSWDDRTLVVIMQRERNDGISQLTSGEPELAQSTDNI